MIQTRFDIAINELLTEATSNEVALAVSGGADSMALLYLASDWAARNNIMLTVFSVNHNLRPESVSDVEFVKGRVKDLGHSFHDLSWNSHGNKVAIQERAREARYQMITAKCHEMGVATLLTAHHNDDMLETYLMRKKKKSGIFGLSYSPNFFYNNIQIIRPLIGLSKSDLINYLTSREFEWVEDESNVLDLYERNRVRKEIAQFSSEQKKQLIVEMQAVNKEAHMLNEQLIKVVAEAVQINNYGFAVINIAKVSSEASDVQIQLLNYILTIISGKTRLPRFRSIQKILSLLTNARKIEHSLHGCILKTTGNKLMVFREKSEIKNSVAKVGNCLLWDNRFVLEHSELHNKQYFIGALDVAQYSKIKDHINLQELSKVANNSHRSILFTLPVIKNLEKIVAIPHISYYDETAFSNAVKVTFRPNFVSRFTHFL
ncbi:MAG: tRNA lysidine(34) synthetase TilS [Rickettsiaceae bacterium]